MDFIDLKSQYLQLEASIDRRIKNVLEHGRYIMGPEVFELEEKLADYCGVKHAITCGNGTDALQLSLMALNIGPGDAVITTAFSFFASAEVISLVGATPIFVDIDESTFNLDPDKLEAAILEHSRAESYRLKAVIAVDLFGLPADYERIETLCREHGLSLVEDAAQSFSAAIGTRKTCSFGDIAATSFFPAKPLGCYGDGGAVFTDSDELAELVRSLKIHGQGRDKYDNLRVGINSRLDTIQAAVLLEKIKILDSETRQKKILARRYSSELEEFFTVPVVKDNIENAYAQYTLKTSAGKRDSLVDAMKQTGVPVQVYYRQPLHKAKAFEKKGSEYHLPVAEKVSCEVFSIPMHAYISQSSVETIIKTLADYSGK